MPVEKLLNETKKYLAPDEESLDTIEGDLDYQNERMMGALSVTNKRIVFCAKKLLGGFVFKELPSTISSIEIKGRVMILNTTTGEKIKFSVLTPFLNTSKKQDVEKFIKTVEEKLNIKRIEVSEKPILKRGWVWLVIFASIFIVILFAISGGKKETIPQVTQPLQQEFQKQQATKTDWTKNIPQSVKDRLTSQQLDEFIALIKKMTPEGRQKFVSDYGIEMAQQNRLMVLGVWAKSLGLSVNYQMDDAWEILERIKRKTNDFVIYRDEIKFLEFIVTVTDKGEGREEYQKFLESIFP